jgi:integrase
MNRDSTTPPFSPLLTLEQASGDYLERRKPYLRERSLEAYRYHFRSLSTFYGADKILSSFHEGDLRNYQKWRTRCGGNTVKNGSSLVNHELGALAQLLSLADLWHPISKYYERLPEPDWKPPRVLSPAEEDRFIRFGSRKPEWKTAINAALITGNSTIFGCELRTLRLADIELEADPPLIKVHRETKNAYRVRSVPLNAVAVNGVRNLLAQARERGSLEKHHYLIPFRVKKGTYDPERPASSCFIRASFRAIARSCGLGWVTPRCFRHQAITKLLESGAADETVRAIAGHNSEKAMRYYSHIRIEAKKQAVDGLIAPSRKNVRHSPGRNRPILASVKDIAIRLGIDPEAGIELILQYERTKSTSH